MSKLRRLQPVAVALLLVLLLTSCVSTKRPPLFTHRHPIKGGSAPALKVATLDELNATLARNYTAVHSFVASVTLTASSGGVYEGQTKDYIPIRGHILFRKPDDIRIQGSKPVIET